MEVKYINYLDKLKELINTNGWSIYNINFSDGVGWEIGKFSPLGEDFNICIQHNNDFQTAITEISNYANDFDIDEHVAMWIEARKNGVKGVPNSIKSLVEDAEDIQNMLEQLSNSCQNFLKYQFSLENEMEIC